MDNEGLFIQKGFSLKNKQASKQTKTLAPASYLLQELVYECFLKTNSFLEFLEFLSALQKASEIPHSQTLSVSLSCCP